MRKIVSAVLGVGIFSLLTGCTAVTSPANRVIIGTVSDVDGKPVAGAIVTTSPISSSVSTDKEGRYMIKSLQEGEYTLHANKLGYVSQPTRVKVRGVEFVQGDVQIIPEELMPASSPAYAVPTYVEPAPEVETQPVQPASSPKEKAPEGKKDLPTSGASSGLGEKSAGSKAWWEK
ncbi:MAG: carboxypeptidase regulatory-like domain-containing protein [Candidatus Schekmanbacteria bacterium]|nr:carboxypeptidase regulatory-like domain-containing protein [Candidatus Schekmanbacteria bacterium]